MKKIITLSITLITAQTMLAALQTPTPAAPAGPSTASIFAAALGQAAISALTGVGPGGAMSQQSALSVNFDFDVTNQEMGQTCYGELSNSVTNLNKGETTIVSGSCASSGASSKLGKAGDITIIPVNQLTSAGNLGTVSQLKTTQFTVPPISGPTTSGADGWHNALSFTFKPSSPTVNTKWSKQGITSSQLAGRESQIVIRTRELTQRLAQSEGQHYQPNKILLEVWGRTNPSITGSKEFKQIFNIVLSANDIGKKMIFGGDQTANAGIAFIFQDSQEQPTEIASAFNVITESP